MIKAIQDRLELELDEMKAYLKISVLVNDEALTLQNCIDTAKEQADSYCNNSFSTIDEEGIETLNPIPLTVKIAVMQIASTLFTERNDHITGMAVGGYSVNQGVPTWNAFKLLNPFRKFYV